MLYLCAFVPVEAIRSCLSHQFKFLTESFALGIIWQARLSFERMRVSRQLWGPVLETRRFEA